MAKRNVNDAEDFGVTSIQVTLAVTAGDWIVVASSWLAAGAVDLGATPISDGVNTYSLPTGADWTNPKSGGSIGRAACWVAKAQTTTTLTITVTVASAATMAIVAACFSGRDGTDAVEAATSNYQVNVAAGADAITTPTWTGTNGADIFGFGTDFNLTVSITPGTGFTTANLVNPSDFFEGEYKDNESAGTRAATFTRTTANQDVLTFGISLKLPAGGGGGLNDLAVVLGEPTVGSASF